MSFRVISVFKVVDMLSVSPVAIVEASVILVLSIFAVPFVITKVVRPSSELEITGEEVIVGTPVVTSEVSEVTMNSVVPLTVIITVIRLEEVSPSNKNMFLHINFYLNFTIFALMCIFFIINL